MGKTELIQQIRRIAAEIQPYTSSHTIGQSVWNGEQYAPVVSPKSMDPYALSWWATLITIAAMLEYQEDSLSGKQLEYLHRTLLGGMGSFNDFSLDEKLFGSEAGTTNRNLSRLRHELFLMFREYER